MPVPHVNVSSHDETLDPALAAAFVTNRPLEYAIDQFALEHWSTTVTRSEPRTSLHPQQRGRKLRYLLRHWRHAEARRTLWHMLAGWARSLLPHRPAPPPASALSLRAMLRWLHPGVILLDADGDELAWLEGWLARRPGPVAIAYRSDSRRTARFGYHPVETVWLLEQAGYQVWLLTQAGPTARPVGWHTAGLDNRVGCWLLATPADPGERP